MWVLLVLTGPLYREQGPRKTLLFPPECCCWSSLLMKAAGGGGGHVPGSAPLMKLPFWGGCVCVWVGFSKVHRVNQSLLLRFHRRSPLVRWYLINCRSVNRIVSNWTHWLSVLSSQRHTLVIFIWWCGGMLDMNPVTGKLMAKYAQSIYMQIKTIKKRSVCFCSAVHCVNLICREAGGSDCLILNRRKKMWFLFLVDNMRVMFNGTIGLIVSECLLSACIDYLILHNVTATAAEYKEPFF